ncbi:MAG: PilZ domain-containing protein [Rhodospirillales bacterium]|nr:PilZ domain-containing protein [Rhodospirillales bacterium]
MLEGLAGLLKVFSRGIGLNILPSFLPPAVLDYRPDLLLPSLGLGLVGIAIGSVIVLALVVTTVPAIRRLIDVATPSNDARTVTSSVIEAPGCVNARLKAMNESHQAIMRAGAGDNQRLNERHTVNVAAVVQCGAVRVTCLLHEISPSGAAVLDRLVNNACAGTAISLELPGLRALPGVVVALTDKNMPIGLEIPEEDMSGVVRLPAGSKSAA